MPKCPKCETEMEPKGQLANDSRQPDFVTDFYQCPKCKNIEMQKVVVERRRTLGGRTLPKEHWTPSKG